MAKPARAPAQPRRQLSQVMGCVFANAWPSVLRLWSSLASLSVQPTTLTYGPEAEHSAERERERDCRFVGMLSGRTLIWVAFS